MLKKKQSSFFMADYQEKIAKPIFNQNRSVQPVKPVVDKPVITKSRSIVTKDIPEEQKLEEAAGLIPNEDYHTSPLFYEIANYFSVESKEFEEAKMKLSEITDWAILEGKSNKPEDVMRVIRRLENKLATPDWGLRRYKHVYQYIRLASQRDRYNKALSAFEAAKK